MKTYPEPTAATEFDAYARRLRTNARRIKQSVRGTFNGTPIVAHPTSDLRDLNRIYVLRRELKNLAEIASQKKLDC